MEFSIFYFLFFPLFFFSIRILLRYVAGYFIRRSNDRRERLFLLPVTGLSVAGGN